MGNMHNFGAQQQGRLREKCATDYKPQIILLGATVLLNF
jgi:RecG-like helicase